MYNKSFNFVNNSPEWFLRDRWIDLSELWMFNVIYLQYFCYIMFYWWRRLDQTSNLLLSPWPKHKWLYPVHLHMGGSRIHKSLIALFYEFPTSLSGLKGRGTCGSGERNVKIWIDFRKSPRFSLTSPLSQLREKSSRPVFTMCGEPWSIHMCVRCIDFDPVWFKLLKYWLNSCEKVCQWPET
jgi:hypothetical protein